MVKFQRAWTRARSDGKHRIYLPQHSLLHFSRHDEFLLHLVIFAFDLGPVTLQFLYVVQQQIMLQTDKVADKHRTKGNACIVFQKHSS